MSKALITGMRTYSFKDKQTGELKEGMSVFFKETLEAYNECIARGWSVAHVDVKPKTELYMKMIASSYDKPFEAEFVYDIKPGKRKMVLLDIVF